LFEPDAAAEAVKAVGLRGLLADPFLWDRAALPAVKRAPANLSRSLDLLGRQLRRNIDDEARVRGYVTVYGIGTASDELQLAAKECADRAGTVFAQHQSFTRLDVEDDDARFGCHPLAHYADLGTLGRNVLFFHLNFVRDDEAAFLRQSSCSVAWCPAASMISGAGGTFNGRHLELYKQGVNIALGSDATTTGHRFDVGLQAFLAVLTAREKTQNRQTLNAEDGLEMATVNGARALGMASVIGSLEPGKRADIVVRDMDLPEANPGVDVAQSLIFSAGSKSVATVIVDGEIIIEDGRSTRVDETHVYSLARASTQRVSTRLGIPRRSRWPSVE
jgi:5-methylthioadenosine/S-adenosylhomocysteine deaminase